MACPRAAIKSEEKRISGEAYNVNKQTIYIAPKSTNESRAQYSAEIRRGKKRRRQKETTGQKYNGLPYITGWP